MGGFARSSGDFCAYIRNVVYGLLLTLAIAFITVFLGSLMLAGIANIVLFVYHFIAGTHYAPGDFMSFGTGFLGIVVGLFVFVYLYSLLDKFRNARAEANADKPDSFLKAAYKSFKDKVCFKVNFNGE